MWFIGDWQLRFALEVLMKHKDRFYQLDSLEGFDTRFTEAMMLEHTLAMVLDMVNRYKYLPELIVIHVGASDFSRVTNHQIQVNIQNMVLNCKKITTAACRSTDSFWGFMFSLMSLPFYIKWDSQRVVRRARTHFNGSLAKHAQRNGGYIIRHPDIMAATDLGLYDPNNQGDLIEIRYLLMMKDIAQRIQTIVVLFMVALGCRRQPMAMHNSIQAAHRRDSQK